ncbi:hypothetical protein FGG08_005386, partial [Glutinoglossum americanum]
MPKADRLSRRMDMSYQYCIPVSLVDVAEKIGDEEFELFFPLTHLKEFQRAALVVGGARGLLVRIRSTNPPEFCMHLHPEPHSPTVASHAAAGLSAGTGGHRYWRASNSNSEPDNHFCSGGPKRATYQLSRALFRHLVNAPISLEAVHRMLASEIDKLAHSCMVCGKDVGARLWRPTTCTKICSVTLRRSNLEVRLIDLHNDPAVVDLLLAMVHAAASTSLDICTLLPGCPITNKARLIQTLDNTPAVSTFQSVHDLTASVKRLGSQTEALLSWICTSYRGFLACATGSLKIPSMPGVHQFVLANTAPELERRFAVQLQGQQSRVVFHGTSLGRLYIILRNGLRIRRGSLQVHGAVYGGGIYTTEDPAAAMGFAAACVGRPTSTFHGVRVLLMLLLVPCPPQPRRRSRSQEYYV